MSATSTTSRLRSQRRLVGGDRPATARQRAAAIVSAATASVLGLLPHVLHHVGPLAGAALLAGTGGTVLFGAIGLLAAIPFLLGVHRRCGNWALPGALLALFAAMFSVSAFVIGPAINGEGSSASRSSTPTHSTPSAPAPDSHAAHHQ